MNAKENLACASSGRSLSWKHLDWRTTHRTVRKLQARIVKATKDGCQGKVRALQWLLTHSLSGKALAVKRVTENQGKRTPGVDGAIWSTPVAKTRAVLSLGRRGYTPQPLRRVYIPKGNGKLRPLGIPTMTDRAMQALYLLALDPVSETTADKHSYGFRKGRSTHDALAQCFLVLCRPARSPQWVFEADIKGCFDNISHDWVLEHIPMDTPVLRKWLKAGMVDRAQWVPTEVGTPQGGIVSPTLANMVLDGLEGRLARRFPRPKGKAPYPKVRLIRYADDFVITGATKETLEQVKKEVAGFLSERGLSLAPEKTRIVHVSDGFDFLGFNVRTYHGKLLIKPSKDAQCRIHRHVRHIIRGSQAVTQHDLISWLNPLIRGWANYYRHVVSKRTFSTLDHVLWKALWRWAVRRHPKKGRRWVAKRYFQTFGTRSWVFACTHNTDQHEAPEWVKLTSASDTTIRRHVKVKADANPYDPKWKSYFAGRRSVGAGPHGSLKGLSRIRGNSYVRF
jgi:RNA-directed DNA polymerase